MQTPNDTKLRVKKLGFQDDSTSVDRLRPDSKR
jgi:hypothetical protein